MTPSSTVTTAELNEFLAREYFSRTRVSSLWGMLAVAMMAYPHRDAGLGPSILGWVAAMLLILSGRAALGYYGIKGWIDRYGIEAVIRGETALALMLGFGWGSALFLFDSGRMEPLFYFRLVMVAAVATFVLSSSTAFLRMPIICAATIGSVVLAYLQLHPYIEPHGVLVAATLLQALAIAGLAFSINRRVRIAASDHLAVIKLSQALETSARTDELTQIANRRGILDSLAGELAKSARHALPLSVVMADIDHFKVINDTHGHAAGDEALKETVRALTAGLREGDRLGRLGGEEFLILLPMLEESDALAVANRLRQAVQETKLAFDGKPIPLSISMGLARFRQVDGVDSLLARADAALYAAKRAGRNRVVADAAAPL
jgi:diguanylate cyclase (GGDEF)-like protein